MRVPLDMLLRMLHCVSSEDDGHKTASGVGGTFVSGVAGTEGEAEREGIAAAVLGVAGEAAARAVPLSRSMRMCDGGARGGSRVAAMWKTLDLCA